MEPPHGCVCPSESYTCRADFVGGLNWVFPLSPDDTINYGVSNPGRSDSVNRNGLKFTFSEKLVSDGVANITSQLTIENIAANETTVTCQVFRSSSKFEKNLTVCVVGERNISMKP